MRNDEQLHSPTAMLGTQPPPHRQQHHQQHPRRRDGLPTLELSPAQTAQLRAIETRLLEQYLERYEDHVASQRTVDATQWKPSKHANGVRVYRRRSAATPPHRFSLRRHDHDEPRSEPMLLATGSVDGRVEDVLYGALWSSRDERLARAHYTKDGVVDAAVLAAIDKPSRMDPFRSLAVKWSLQRAAHSAAVVKDRDFVYLGATGTVKSAAGGARLGFELRHSLKLPAFASLASGAAVRAEIMSCSFFRQLRGLRVEVFHLASFDAGGELLAALAWRHAADAYLGYAAVVDAALTKKLVRAVQWEAPVNNNGDPTGDSDLGRRCGVCAQLSSHALHRKCALCQQWVCAQCSVKREIFTPLPGRPPIARCFCRPCLARVARDDATDYVHRELAHFEQRTASEFDLGLPHHAAPPVMELPSPPPPPPIPPPAPLRRRQGSVPAPLQRASAASSSTQRRSVPAIPYPIEPVINDENLRHAANRSTLATRGSAQPSSGEILLRSDAGRKKWRHREREQLLEQQDPGHARRRMTVLGSEMASQPPPPQPERRSSLAGVERRKSVTPLDAENSPFQTRRNPVTLGPDAGGTLPPRPPPPSHRSSQQQHATYVHGHPPPLLGQAPLQERRQYVLLPQPDPQVLTSRRVEPRPSPPPRAVRSDKIIRIRSSARPSASPPLPPPPPPPSVRSDDEQHRRQVARDTDELAVTTLLAELCEIARMTNDFSATGSSSMRANPASPASVRSEGPPPLLSL